MAKPNAKGTSRASKPRKSVTKSKSPPQAAAKAKPRSSEAKPVKLLSGGNPQVAKADGDAPVLAYIAAIAGWMSDFGKRLDALIVRNVPNVRKAVKWNSHFYGIEGQGWFLSFHVFTGFAALQENSPKTRCFLAEGGEFAVSPLASVSNPCQKGPFPCNTAFSCKAR